jgi:hypothetical protein
MISQNWDYGKSTKSQTLREISLDKEKGGILMMKNALLLAMAMMMLAVPIFATEEKVAIPTISNLVVDMENLPKIGEAGRLTLKFQTNQRPEDVIVWVYTATGQRTISGSYSSKKREVRIMEMVEKEGVYEVTVSVRSSSPQRSVYDISVKTQNFAGKQSEWAKTTVEIKD